MESGSKPYLTFRLARKNFAIEACLVRGILPVEELTLLPGMRPSVLGMASLGGRFFTVLDLRIQLHLSHACGGIDPYIVVVSVGEHLAGFVADRVSGVHPYHLRDLRHGYLRGLGRPRLLLDPEKIIGAEDLEGLWSFSPPIAASPLPANP